MKRTLMTRAIDPAIFLMQAAAEGGEGSAPTGTKIRPDLGKYQTAKSASGSSTKICGDEVSKALLGATLDEAYKFVAKVVDVPETDLRTKYGSRNLGQQRMFLGNLIRGAFAGKDTDKASRVSKAFEAELAGFRVAIDTRIAADVAAKQKEKDAKKLARDEARAKKKAEDDKAKAAKKAAADAKKAEDDKAKTEKAGKKAADALANKQLKDAAKAPKAPKEPKQPK